MTLAILYGGHPLAEQLVIEAGCTPECPPLTAIWVENGVANRVVRWDGVITHGGLVTHIPDAVLSETGKAQLVVWLEEIHGSASR